MNITRAKRTGLSFWLAVFAAASLFSGRALAYNQPPFNMSATSFLDGGGGPAGLYFVDYAIFTDGAKALDGKGKTIPGGARVNVLTLLNQLVYQSNVKVLGGNLMGTALVPIVAPTVSGSMPHPPTGASAPVTVNTAGVGDPIAGAGVQWTGTLFGKPFFHRAEVDVTFPVGRYDKNLDVNPGAHVAIYEPYYVCTWIPDPLWDIDLKAFYAVNGRNNETKVKPGQLLHFNFAASRQMGGKWRLGVSGYYAQQLTEDKGTSSTDTKERAIGIGPGLVYQGEGLMLMLTHPIEFGVQNRFQGSRTTLQFVHRF